LTPTLSPAQSNCAILPWRFLGICINTIAAVS
jgi:hypothetical protein